MSRNLGKLEVREADPGSNPAPGFGAVYLGSESAAPGTIYKRSSGGVLIPVGFGNPMTTSQDIIVGGISGAAGRLAKGANYSSLGVNGSGNVAYQQNTALLYELHVGADIWNNGSVSAGTWTAFADSGTFTKASDNSLLEFVVRCAVYCTYASTPLEVGTRLRITKPDSSIVYKYLGSGGLQTTALGNFFAGNGPVFIAGNAGTWSIGAEVYSSGSLSGVYCRCSSQPNLEWFEFQVVEHF